VADDERPLDVLVNFFEHHDFALTFELQRAHDV
jgi:hypothetical protein